MEHLAPTPASRLTTSGAAGARRAVMVVPTYNERENIGRLVARVFAAAPGCHLLVVDDASPDGTGEACRALMAPYGNLLLVERAGERGLGSAYLAGIRTGIECGFPVIGTMDADLSHDPVHLPGMLERLERADVVIGSRYVAGGAVENWSRSRKALSWAANRFAGILLGVRARDVTSGYRLYRTEALRRLDFGAIHSTGYAFLVEILHRLHLAGARIDEVPIVFVDREAGRSKLGLREIPRGAVALIRLRLSAGRGPEAGGRRR